MPVDVIMPKVDMDMAHGTIAQWHVKEGDSVKQGDPLFDIETDKANMEVEAPASGVLHQVSAQNGDAVDIGVCIAQIFLQGESPDIGEARDSNNTSDASYTSELRYSNGTKNVPVKADSYHANAHVNPVEDTLAGADLRVGSSSSKERVRATPLARKLAGQHDLDLGHVTGTGPRGRITKSDVLNAASSATVNRSSSTDRPSANTIKAQLTSLGVAFNSVPVNRMRATIASRLTESKSSIPHFYLESDCRIDKLQSYRQDMNASLENADYRISLNDLVVLAAAKALEEVPEANVAWAGSELIQYSDSDISVAVSLPDGLVTPVVRAAQSMSISKLALHLDDLNSRAKAGKLLPEEYQGGSMSVSNLGMHGVQKFQAIINPPQSMILAVGSATRQFIPDEDDQPVLAQLMSVCLSCDHRVLDGVVAACWLQAFRERLENPVSLLM